jgi:hypothetical protein
MGTPSGGDAEKSQQEAATTAQLLALQQALDHLVQTEQRLLAQWHDLQGQIDGYTKEAQQAWQANRQDLAEQAVNKRTQLMPTLAGIQEQMQRIQARKEEIARQRQDLGAGRSSPARTGSLIVLGPSQTSTSLPARSRHPRLWWTMFSLGVLIALLLIAALGAGYVLIVRSPAPKATATVRPSPTHMPTATPYPQPTPQAHPFQPNGTAPTDQDCQRIMGRPCYSPEQVQQAFGLSALYRPGFDGTGQTIVILGAGQAGTVKSDLAHFDQAWGLPDPPSFQILQPKGPPALYVCPGGVDSLAIENTLDVEWAHAIAPGANIVLLIWSNGSSRSQPDQNCGLYELDAGVSYIASNHLGNIISISYGGSELGDVSETASQVIDDQNYYRQAHQAFEDATQQGVTILAAAGDEGATNSNDVSNPNSVWPSPNVSWPASDPAVLAVGGTLLQLQDESGDYGGEHAWQEGDYGAGGGGLSTVFDEPAYQQTQPHQDMFSGKRAIPDVSFPADDFALYSSFLPSSLGRSNQQWNNWGIIGGTSLSTPCWAGLIAILNQMRGGPSGDLHAALYSLHGTGFHDITSGNNSFGGVQGYNAGSGYDLSTGWGSPIANRLLPALIAALDDGTSGQCPGGQRVCA